MWDNTEHRSQADRADADLLPDFVFATLAGLLLGAVAFVAALTVGITVPGLWG